MNRKYLRIIKIASAGFFLTISLHGVNWLAKAALERDYSSAMGNGTKTEYVSNTIQDTNPEHTPHLHCAPENSVSSTIVGTQTDSRGVPYAMWLYEPASEDEEMGTDSGSENSVLMVTSLFGQACGLAYNANYGGYITERVPLSVARSLTSQLFKYFSDNAGGFEQFKTDILQTLEYSYDMRASGRRFMDSEEPTYTSVEIWAFNDIGITIPTDYYKLVDIDDKWIYDYKVD